MKRDTEEYPFRIVNHEEQPLGDPTLLYRRPFARVDRSFQADARRFIPGDELETAMNTSIATGQPLLITGEPGTGKTQSAYYAAHKLGIEPVIHFQVKSDSAARDLLYDFDDVRYFRESHAAREGAAGVPDKARYVERRPLWEAMQSEHPRVLLIDEIDKAPRDFPNDLLHELDKMEFAVPETGELVTAEPRMRPIVFITSNSERRLPAPFLRRCVYHHIRFDDALVRQAAEARRDQYGGLGEDFLTLALERFLALREENLRKKPATGEFLVWLGVLALARVTAADRLTDELAELPHLEVLVKDHQDREDLKQRVG